MITFEFVKIPYLFNAPNLGEVYLLPTVLLRLNPWCLESDSANKLNSFGTGYLPDRTPDTKPEIEIGRFLSFLLVDLLRATDLFSVDALAIGRARIAFLLLLQFVKLMLRLMLAFPSMNHVLYFYATLFSDY